MEKLNSTLQGSVSLSCALLWKMVVGGELLRDFSVACFSMQ